MMVNIDHAIEAAIAELQRQADRSGCTTEADGKYVQVDGSFDIRSLVEAILAASQEQSNATIPHP